MLGVANGAALAFRTIPGRPPTVAGEWKRTIVVSPRSAFEPAPAVAAGIHEGRVERALRSRPASPVASRRRVLKAMLGPVLPIARRLRSFLSAPMVAAVAGAQEHIRAEHASVLRRLEQFQEQNARAIAERDAALAELTDEVRRLSASLDESRKQRL